MNRLRLAPALLLPALLCFFLPYARYRFGFGPIDRFRAFDFIFGVALHVNGAQGDADQLDPDAFMAIAAAAVLAALIASLYRGRANHIAASVLAGVALASVLCSQNTFYTVLEQRYGSSYKVDCFAAYYMLPLLLAFTAASSLPFAVLFRLLRRIPLSRYTLKRVHGASP
jgi:hypothetical protein